MRALAAAALLLLASSTRAADPDSTTPEADAAFAAKDYARAASLWRACAQKGDAWCQFRLGILYFSGTGVPRDRAQSMAWLEKSAGQGFRRAELRLGKQLSFEGRPAEARPWLQRAADHGDAYAKGLLVLLDRNPAVLAMPAASPPRKPRLAAAAAIGVALGVLALLFLRVLLSLAP